MKTIYGLILRSVGTRGRVVAMGLLGLIAIVIAVFLRRADGTTVKNAADLVDQFGLSLVVSIVSLVVASAAFGSMVEDRTLVYLWLRPIATWKIVLAAYAAALTVVLPITVISLTATAIIAGGGADVAVGAAAATTLAVLAYSALFLALGLMTERALAWGLAYILLWEGVIASIGRGASRLAVRSYSRSALAKIGEVDLELGDLSLPIAILVPLGVVAVALAFASWRLGANDIA